MMVPGTKTNMFSFNIMINLTSLIAIILSFKRQDNCRLNSFKNSLLHENKFRFDDNQICNYNGGKSVTTNLL